MESGCVLGKVHQLIWQWPIAGELEVGDSNQLVLTKISCLGGGDPYWFTAHDIPDDDKFVWLSGGGSHSLPSIKKKKKKTLVGSAETWGIVHTRVGAAAPFPSVLLMIDWSQRFSGKTKMKAVMGGQRQQPVLARWVRAPEP